MSTEPLPPKAAPLPPRPAPPPGKPARWPSWLALLLTIAGFPFYMLVIDSHFLRSTGLATTVFVVSGAAIAVARAWRDRRWLVRIPAGLSVAVLALWFVAFFGLGSVPPPAAIAGELSVAPDFTLPDEQGRPVTLASAISTGPVLLVFYRGHW